jgi:hypothetical protein
LISFDLKRYPCQAAQSKAQSSVSPTSAAARTYTGLA